MESRSAQSNSTGPQTKPSLMSLIISPKVHLHRHRDPSVRSLTLNTTYFIASISGSGFLNITYRTLEWNVNNTKRTYAEYMCNILTSLNHKPKVSPSLTLDTKTVPSTCALPLVFLIRFGPFKYRSIWWGEGKLIFMNSTKSGREGKALGRN